MTAIVVGSITVGSPTGDVDTYDNPVLPHSGSSNVDTAVGAFTTKGDLPEINSPEDWDAFAAAMLATTTSTYDGGITVTGLAAHRFVGVGGGGNDLFEAYTTGGARIEGRGGDDTLTATGVDADDTLNGGEGDDRLFSAAGDDVVDGGEGNDTLIGTYGDDTMVGGTGIDTVDYYGAGFAVTVSLAVAGPQTVSVNLGSQVLTGIESLVGQNGADSLTGDDGANRLDGAGNNDTLDGGGGDDTLVGGVGRNSLIGGAGFDWLSYADTPDSMTVLLGSDIILRQHSATTNVDHATGIEGIIGSAFGDDLAGNLERNAILGGDGDDLIRGLENADTLEGGDGGDYVEGDEGNDVLTGGGGDDTLDGGAGSDTADYRAAVAAVTVTLLDPGLQDTGGAGLDALFGVEALIGSAFRDTLTGDFGANRLDGRGGQDRLHGAGGSDTLIGAAGKDLLDGGVGADWMSGGPGKDRYYYDAPDELAVEDADTISDLSNEDRILLNSVDAKVDKAGDQAFDLVAAFTGKSGQAVLLYDAGADITELRLDMTGDAVADGLIRILGDHTGFTNFAL